MNVRAADESGLATSKSGYGVVTVQLGDVNDHAPVFDTCCLRGSLLEESPPGKRCPASFRVAGFYLERFGFCLKVLQEVFETDELAWLRHYPCKYMDYYLFTVPGEMEG